MTNQIILIMHFRQS